MSHRSPLLNDLWTGSGPRTGVWRPSRATVLPHILAGGKLKTIIREKKHNMEIKKNLNNCKGERSEDRM